MHTFRYYDGDATTRDADHPHHSSWTTLGDVGDDVRSEILRYWGNHTSRIV